MRNTVKTFGVIAITAIIALGMVACASVSIVNVDWDSLEGPGKTRQYLGVSSQEVTVFANYKDESRKEVTFLSASHDKDKTGIQTVTVTVMGQGSGTFQTEVMEMTGIRVERAPSKTAYTVGEKADLAGIKVMGSWSDLPDAEIPTYQVTVGSFDSSSAGNKVVTVNFKGKTATFPVTVTAAATPAPAAAAAPAPAASQPSQPAQPAPSASTFNPAANQPAPTGTWRQTLNPNTEFITTVIYVFNANGTGSMRVANSGGDKTFPATWTASGNRLTVTVDWGEPVGKGTNVWIYSISGNTLTIQNEGYTATDTLTRQ